MKARAATMAQLAAFIAREGVVAQAREGEAAPAALRDGAIGDDELAAHLAEFAAATPGLVGHLSDDVLGAHLHAEARRLSAAAARVDAAAAAKPLAGLLPGKTAGWLDEDRLRFDLAGFVDAHLPERSANATVMSMLRPHVALLLRIEHAVASALPRAPDGDVATRVAVQSALGHGTRHPDLAAKDVAGAAAALASGITATFAAARGAIAATGVVDGSSPAEALVRSLGTPPPNVEWSADRVGVELAALERVDAAVASVLAGTPAGGWATELERHLVAVGLVAVRSGRHELRTALASEAARVLRNERAAAGIVAEFDVDAAGARALTRCAAFTPWELESAPRTLARALGRMRPAIEQLDPRALTAPGGAIAQARAQTGDDVCVVDDVALVAQLTSIAYTRAGMLDRPPGELGVLVAAELRRVLARARVERLCAEHDVVGEARERADGYPLPSSDALVEMLCDRALDMGLPAPDDGTLCAALRDCAAAIVAAHARRGAACMDAVADVCDRLEVDPARTAHVVAQLAELVEVAPALSEDQRARMAERLVLLDRVIRAHVLPFARRRARLASGVAGTISDERLAEELLGLAGRDRTLSRLDARHQRTLALARRGRRHGEPAEVEPIRRALGGLRRHALAVLRSALVDALEHRYRLFDVVDAAREHGCADADEQQVAYCVAAVCLKRDGPGADGLQRRYGIDIGAPSTPGRLRAVADEVARNLVADGEAYDHIHDEPGPLAAQFARALGRLRPGADVDADADALEQRIRDEKGAFDVGRAGMTLASIRAREPGRADYVFASQLAAWVGKIAGRDATRSTEGDGPVGDADDTEPHVKLDESNQLRTEVAVAWAASIERFRNDRERTLDDLERALRALEGRAAGYGGLSGDAAAAFATLLALTRGVLADLALERMAFPEMLCYVMFPLRGRERLLTRAQLVAILSFRRGHLDADMAAHLGRQLHDALAAAGPLLERLRPRVAGATAAPAGRRNVPKSRTSATARMLGGRCEECRELVAVLHRLPRSIADDAALGRLLGQLARGESSTSAISTLRGQVAAELGLIDSAFRRGYARYAMRI